MPQCSIHRRPSKSDLNLQDGLRAGEGFSPTFVVSTIHGNFRFDFQAWMKE